MAHANTFDDIRLSASDIEVRKITTADLKLALKAGYADFSARPTFGVFLILVYPLSALLFTLFLQGGDLPYLAFPVVAGFTLLGPVVSLALFELSRRREQGLELSWRGAFEFVHYPTFSGMLALTLVMAGLYLAWLFMAEFLYFGLFGANPPTTVAEFGHRLIGTQPGIALILYGNALGLIFAFMALAISVVGFPLLLDKPVSFATAVGTSVRAVASNLYVMLLWGLIVVTLLTAGAAVLLVGLAAVLPVLGHATWHLYRRLVVA